MTFFSPLVDAMTAKEPAQRPTAEDALKQFYSIVSKKSYFTLRRRLVGKDEVKDFKSVAFENVCIFMDAALTPVRFALSIPSKTVRTMSGHNKSKEEKLNT